MIVQKDHSYSTLRDLLYGLLEQACQEVFKVLHIN